MVDVNETLCKKVADLARLELTPHEIATYTEQLGQILSYVEQLTQVNVCPGGQDIDPLTHPFSLSTPLREDRAVDSPKNAQGLPKTLDSAPSIVDHGFEVPSIL